MLIGCVLFHGVGLASLNKAMRSEASIERLRHIEPLSPRGALFTLLIVLALIVLHGLEIWGFALLYLALDAVAHLKSRCISRRSAIRPSATATPISSGTGGCSALSRAFSA